ALRFTPAFAALMRFEVERTRSLFADGRALVPRMPRALAVDVDLFSSGGLAILDRIAARGFDVLTARPSLSRWTKARLLARAAAAMTMARLRDGFAGPARGPDDGGPRRGTAPSPRSEGAP